MSSIFRKVTAVCVISLFLILKVAAAEAAYYLIAAEGYVAVLESESGKIYFTEIPTDRLPHADVRKLEQGIACSDKTDLAAALENFDS